VPKQTRPWPDFDSPLLRAIADALRRRGKAIRHQTTAFACTQDWSESADGTLERLNAAVDAGRDVYREEKISQ